MNSFVNLEIFGSGKNFSAARERAGERLLPGVDPNVVDQLVLCLEGLSKVLMFFAALLESGSSVVLNL